ncbi:MAG TPA: BON domain-containing protein [Candidatus Angelobacter sp.]|nr:BON domain-containing protein [Candidatus Angelobacter sp.]
MKTTIFFTALIAGALLPATLAIAQTTGAGAPHVAPPPRDVPARPFVPSQPVQPNSGAAPIQNPSTIQPSVTAQGSATIATNPMVAATNSLQGTNSFAGNTNGLNLNIPGNQAVTANDRVLLTTLLQGVKLQLGVNSMAQLPVHFLISNGAVTVTGVVRTANERDRIFAGVQRTPGVLSAFDDLRVGTNGAAIAGAAQNQPSFFTTSRDHAFSPADQTLLTAVEQKTAAQLGINGSSAAQMPIHFSIQNGVVGVTGNLVSAAEKQVVLAAIQQIPGVVRVVDDIGVTGSGTDGVNATVGSQNPFLIRSNNLAPTSVNPTRSNRIFMNTNASGR